MKDLSKETISLVVSALITVRLDAVKELQEAQRAGHIAYKAQVQQAIQENGQAIQELNDEVAPWLRFHPQLLDVFPASGTALDPSEAAQKNRDFSR